MFVSSLDLFLSFVHHLTRSSHQKMRILQNIKRTIVGLMNGNESHHHWAIRICILLSLEHFCRHSLYDFRSIIPEERRQELVVFLKSLVMGKEV